MALTLYKHDLSPAARTVLMVIEHLKLPVQFVDVNIFKGEQLTKEFKKINPQHTVPTLIDGDFVLADSHAISTYLINKYAKEDSLYPSEPKLRAIVDQRLHFDSGILFPAARNAFRHVFQEGKGLNNEHVSKIKSAYKFSNKFTTKTWLAGEQFTVADVSWVSCISSLDEMVPIDTQKYPDLYAWYKRCSEMDIYKEKNVPGCKLFGDVYRSKIA